MNCWRIIPAVLLCLTALNMKVNAQQATITGEVTTPYPTIHNLAIEWAIQGDENLNGVLAVKYRSVGEVDWHKAMPLHRVPAGHWSESRPGYPTKREWDWKNKHSGSIIDLRPGTEYEIALSLTDPDGGAAERTVRVSTRPVPQAMPGARIKHVSPRNFAAEAANAAPGDLFLLAPGNYGYFAASKDGEPGKPIVFRAEPDGRFVQQTTNRGAALFEGISLQNRKYVYLEGLFSSDSIDLFNAESCAVRWCRVHAPFGIVSAYSGNMAAKWAPRTAARLKPPATPDLWNSQDLLPGATPRPFCSNCYIADNVVVGMTEWTSEAMAVDGKNMGEGIEITGPGNVICHNRVRGFRDCISTLEDQYAVNQVCIDIYNNDISCGPDDGIESDFCMGNCRIMRNRITNCFMGVSSQPSLGGPTYFIRNVMYNLIHSGYKYMRQSHGNITLHNTVVKTGDGASCQSNGGADFIKNSVFLNNIGIGGGGLGKFGTRYRNGSGFAAYFPSADESCHFDYNGYGTIGFPFHGIIGNRRFDSLESLHSATSEQHGVEVDLGIFESTVVIPDPALQEWCPPDMRLRAGSAAMDAGTVIPNINDNFTGRAPDLGAYEYGQVLPAYGPRPVAWDE